MSELYELMNLAIVGAIILVFGVGCFTAGYITHWKKIYSILYLASFGKLVSLMIVSGVKLNLDFLMIFSNQAERESEEQSHKKGFIHSRHTNSVSSHSPVKRKGEKSWK